MGISEGLRNRPSRSSACLRQYHPCLSCLCQNTWQCHLVCNHLVTWLGLKLSCLVSVTFDTKVVRCNRGVNRNEQFKSHFNTQLTHSISCNPVKCSEANYAFVVKRIAKALSRLHCGNVKTCRIAIGEFWEVGWAKENLWEKKMEGRRLVKRRREEEEGFEVRNEKTVGGRSQNHVLHEKLWNTTLLWWAVIVIFVITCHRQIYVNWAGEMFSLINFGASHPNPLSHHCHKHWPGHPQHPENYWIQKIK